MLSAPVFDSWEGQKPHGATGDANFGKKFFPRVAQYPPFRALGEGGPKTFFSETASTLRRAGPQCLWSSNDAESKPFRACTAVEAATIVHDVRYVT